MSDGPLPPDWEATTDPSSGNTYYYNTKTNAVSWERPRGALWLFGGGVVGRSAALPLARELCGSLCWLLALRRVLAPALRSR